MICEQCDKRVVPYSRVEDMEREIAALEAKLSDVQKRARTEIERLSAFFAKYALPSKTKPSCIVCGRADRPVAVEHAELPSIIVCTPCRDKAIAPVTTQDTKP